MQKRLDKDSCYKYVAQKSVIICLLWQAIWIEVFLYQNFFFTNIVFDKERASLFRIYEQRV
jgi:hypothetical protein